MDTKEERVAWVLAIAGQAARHGPATSRARACTLAKSPACQYFWGVLILASFAINCLQTQPGWVVDPHSVADIAFTAAFSAALLINALGNWFW